MLQPVYLVFEGFILLHLLVFFKERERREKKTKILKLEHFFII